MMADSAAEAARAGANESSLPPDSPSRPPVPQWRLTTRIAFRFCFVYFTLSSFTNQIIIGLIAIPEVETFDLGSHWPLRQLTFWAAAHVFHVTRPLIYTDSGSGDKTFDWVQVSCLLVISLLVTAVWSAVDRRRMNYVTLHK